MKYFEKTQHSIKLKIFLELWYFCQDIFKNIFEIE